MRMMRRSMSSAVNLPVDLLVYDNADFSIRSALPSTMEHKIAADGTMLYEQSINCNDWVGVCIEDG